MKEPVFVSPAEIAASKAAAKRVKDEVYDLGLTYHIELSLIHISEPTRRS